MDVIIIGAGAAGLMAAKKLSEAGFAVCVLEARDRIGGRIHTIRESDLAMPAEGGAEFIHGNLEVTLDLLKEAGINKQEIKGKFWHVSDSQWTQKNEFFENAEMVMRHLTNVKEDISISDFINLFFAEEKCIKLRSSLSSYIEGYYSGNIELTSAKSFLAEWMSEDEQQYRPAGGYGKMINYLAESCQKAGTIIHLSAVVKEIKWQKGKAEIIDVHQNRFLASKVIVTVPLGVWVADENAEGAIIYSPALQSKKEAAKQMGFGSVIKILLEFEDIFWEEEAIMNQIKINSSDFHMVLSDMPIPTWWTQLPKHIPLLTGWLSGPKAEKMKNEKDGDIIARSLHSVSSIFSIDSNILKEKLKGCKVFNWTNDPFTRGSYSYSALHTHNARKIIMEPADNTIFFAGEALYEGPETGTVEAALISGLNAAAKIAMA